MTSAILAFLKTQDIKQIARYIVVGLFNTTIILSAYYLALLGFGFNYIGASLFCTLVGIPVGFKAHGSIVFKSPGLFWRYVANFALNFLINTALIGWVAIYVGAAWAPIVLLPVTTVSSYLLMKYFVFIN